MTALRARAVELVGEAGKSFKMEKIAASEELLNTIVSHTQSVWSDLPKYNEMAINRVKSKFSINKMALNYEKVFKNI